MEFKTRSGKKMNLTTVQFHAGSGTLQNPNNPMQFFEIPEGMPKTAWELKKVLRTKGVEMI